MTTWVRKIRQLIRAFLGTDDNKYIVTDSLKKIVIFDNGFTYKTKNSTVFVKKDKENTVFTRPNRQATDFTLKSKSPTTWTRKTKS